MNDHTLKALTIIVAVLTLGEFGSAVEIGLGKDPWGAGFAAVFGVFFALATWLLHSERVMAGAIFAGVLCLFEVIEFPSWHKPTALIGATDAAFAVVSLAGLLAVIAVLAGRIRRRAAASPAAPAE